MSRNACVIHISVVTLVQTTRNAPNVVRKMYRPMDPIRLRVPAHAKSPRCAPLPLRAPAAIRPLVMGSFDGPTKWPRQGKAFDYAQQNVNSRALPYGHGEPRPPVFLALAQASSKS